MVCEHVLTWKFAKALIWVGLNPLFPTVLDSDLQMYHWIEIFNG